MAAREWRRSCEIELAMRPMVASCSDSSRSRWLLSRLVRMRSKARVSSATSSPPRGSSGWWKSPPSRARTPATRLPSGRVKVCEMKNTNPLPTRMAAKPQQQEITIQLVDKLRRLVVGTQHAQPNRRSCAEPDSIQGSGQETFVADLDIARFVLRRSGDQLLAEFPPAPVPAVRVVPTISFPQENATWLPATLLTSAASRSLIS